MVLESLAAVSLVGNILQFVDFSSKIVSKTHVYLSTDGSLPENIDMELVTDDLVTLSKKLQASASSSHSDPTLEGLCEACNNIANELLKALGELKANGKNGKWRSVRQALKSVWRKEEIDDIQQRLIVYRGQLMLHIVASIGYFKISCTYIIWSGNTDRVNVPGDRSIYYHSNSLITSSTMKNRPKLLSMLSATRFDMH
jgi:hypothetical protein